MISAGADATPGAARRDVHTTLAIGLADEALTSQLAAIVGAFPDLELVATAADPADVVDIARRYVPDVLVVGADLVASPDAAVPEPAPRPPATPDATLDLAQPGRGPTTDLDHPVAVGLHALCDAVNNDFPAVRIVVVAPDGVNSYGAVLGGAIGCIDPAQLTDRLVDAVRRVAWGEGLLTAEWARATLGDLGNRSGDRKTAGPLGRPILTATELEVLRRTAAGATAADIAAHHGVPERDVNRGAASALVKARRLHADHALAELLVDHH